MKKEAKDTIIVELGEKLKEYPHFYLVDVTGLNAEQTSDLRRKCFKNEIKMIVVKNKLLHKAFEASEIDFEPLYGCLKGNTALMFAHQANVPAKLLKEYKKESGTWGCSCMIQANRPVYNSSYNTTLFQFEDNDFTFTFNQFDKLEYNEEMIDNQLMALIAYYSYLIIGFDLDSFSPKGGEDVLQKCMNLTNNAQTLDYPGWKAYDSDKNRFAIINDGTYAHVTV